VGDLALGGLARLDRVAAVMFASVYRSIEDLSAFEAELRRLESEPDPGPDQLQIEPLTGPDRLAIEPLQDGPVPSGSKSSLASPSRGRTSPPSTRKTERRPHVRQP
jgi:hypothetical protein